MIVSDGTSRTSISRLAASRTWTWPSVSMLKMSRSSLIVGLVFDEDRSQDLGVRLHLRRPAALRLGSLRRDDCCVTISRFRVIDKRRHRPRALARQLRRVGRVVLDAHEPTTGSRLSPFVVDCHRERPPYHALADVSAWGRPTIDRDWRRSARPV